MRNNLDESDVARNIALCWLTIAVLGALSSESVAGKTNQKPAAVTGKSPVASSAAAPAAADQPHLVLNSAGHTAKAPRMMFTSDDKRIVSVSIDKTIRIWDVASGETISILRPRIEIGNEGELFAGAISPDGKYLAAGGYTPGLVTGSRVVYLIALDSGRIEKVFEGHTGNIGALNFSPDGEQLASGSIDRTVRLWNVKTAVCEQVLERQSGFIVQTVYSPDGLFLATAASDATAGIWSRATGKKVHDLKGHTAQLMALAWSPDGKTLATAGYDRFFILWNADGSLRKKSQTFPFEIWSLAFTPDSRRLLVGPARNGPVRVTPRICQWVDLVTFEQRPAFSQHINNLVGAAFSRDGSLAVTCSVYGDDNYLWQTKDGTVVHRLGGNGRESVTTAWRPDAQSIEQAFRTQSNALYQVNSTLLIDQRTTRKGILDSLEALTHKARSGDVAVIFYAGHGDCKLAGQFFLLPVDVNLRNLPESGVSGEELRSHLAKLPCTALLIMDCCYAGSFDAGKKKRALPTEAGDLVRELVRDDQGLVVMCGASKEQESGEEAKFGHGYFTQALIEGLEGKAVSRRDGLVYLTGLQNYVEERVRDLSHDEQYPTIGKPTLIRSFPLSKPTITARKP